MVAGHLNENLGRGEWDIPALVNTFRLKFGIGIDAKIEDLHKEEIKEALFAGLTKAYEDKEKGIGHDMMRHLERMVFLQIIDARWKDHLYAMDTLREGIGLRAYGQRDPLIEYKREAFEMFSQMVSAIEDEAIEAIFKLQPVKIERFKGVFSEAAQEFSHPELERFEASPEEIQSSEAPPKSSPPIKSAQGPKVGRNDPCPCGSGKKFKKCHGR